MKLSIITITYNAEKFLERTIESVINQTERDFEYLIIDGGSKDGTLDIIRRYGNEITNYVSEKDKGIYDAMNKGLRLAKGDYIWFMNAGDQINDIEVVRNLYNRLPENGDVYYGDTLLVDNEGNAQGLRSVITPHKLPKILTWKSFRYGMVVCHQSFIARKSIAPEYIPDHFYSADVDWEIQCLKNSKKIINLEIIVSRYLTGGFSIKNLKKSLLDRYSILKKHFGFFNTVLAHILILFRGLTFVLKKKGKYW
ncbi:Glycosyltransferase involved in cell wall bisynthesis [Pseudarcicella hirudinis]|uniref:Glycosyltransferase involved in cell wall bisynthesis n=1 Tax=Pseudarcicella hirudinis TaxID=1079859 RepID=A0A1I5UET5_9BACT|nr:glycosyltransferase family 2 protein [Pseudarcicella hirudinis]SFP93156.1 Glycosyltransferase involved in cell wall bisynthesis [Pseudarcicella hirudinis]